MPSDKITIKCPLCNWKPANKSQWQCTCGQIWNTFDTVGECPGCKTKWKETQCPSCHEWSAHDDWYIIPFDFESLLDSKCQDEAAKDKNINSKHYFIPTIDLVKDIKQKARDWVSSRHILFATNPEMGHRWMEIFLNEPEQIIPLELGMQQLANGNGFSEETPFSVAGFRCLLSILSLIKNRNKIQVTLFNRIKTESYYIEQDSDSYSFDTDPKRNFVSAELLAELKSIKIRLDSEIFLKPSPFEQYITKSFKKDLGNLENLNRIYSYEPLFEDPDLFYGDKEWMNMDRDLKLISDENRKYFCLLLFSLEIFKTTLLDFSVDEYLFIRGNKDYPNFKGHENRHFRNERPGYLLEKPTSAGIDFNMITDFELEEFVHDMYELMDKYLDVELAGEMMLEAILINPDFEADCSIFERLKTAVEDKLKLLGKSFE